MSHDVWWRTLHIITVTSRQERGFDSFKFSSASWALPVLQYGILCFLLTRPACRRQTITDLRRQTSVPVLVNQLEFLHKIGGGKHTMSAKGYLDVISIQKTLFQNIIILS